MPAFLARTDLSRDDLRLFLRNSEGYPSDAASVRYTVFSWDGAAVSGASLRATRRSVGEYYAPWRADVGNGSYRVVWEVRDSQCSPPLLVEESVFVVDPSDYVCGPSGLKESAVPPQGSGTFLAGTDCGRGDLPLFLKDSAGMPFSAFAVLWTVYDQAGNPKSLRTVASQAAAGEYYAQWTASVPSGDYYVSWEYALEPDSPLESARMQFTVVCPVDPYAPQYSYDCWTTELPTGCSSGVIQPRLLTSCGAPAPDCSGPQLPCPVQTSVPSGFSPPMPSSCCDVEVPRVVHLSRVTLPPGGSYTEQAAFPIPSRVRSVAFYVTYVRGMPNGSPSLRLFWGNGVEETQETLVDSFRNQVSPAEAYQDLSLLDFYGPVPLNDDPINFVLYVNIPGGAKTVRLKIAERGVPGAPGTASITLTASS